MTPSRLGLVGLHAKVFLEAVNLVHPLMQDGHNADVAVREPSPIDEMLFMAEAVAFDTEVGRHGAR